MSFSFVIFGASGDLTRRKLIPALFSFSGCTDEEKLNALIGPLQQQIEQNRKDLAAARSAEAALVSENAELKKENEMMKAEVERVRKETPN